MRPKFSLLLLLFASLLFATSIKAQNQLEEHAREAISKDEKKAAAAIAELRNVGPAGLEALFAVHAAAINQQIVEPLRPSTPEWERLSAALDAVSQQRNSYLSGLYWYTEMGEAKAAAKRSGKPILSLRMLGKLSEEFSCANSRFFRTILYSNAAISKTLREDFVLHWKSVRPVPHVTIDFGDGRKLERTLTGNSIHYILDAQGRTIEALPGLYGPSAFLRALLVSEKVFAKLREAKEPNPGAALVTYRRNRINRLNANWLADIQKSGGGKAPEGFVQRPGPDGKPMAILIAPAAVTKAATEVSLLRSLTSFGESLGRVTDEASWRKIAQLHLSDAQLDSRSIGLIQRETRKVIGKNDLKGLLEKLQLNVAMDSVRNEYLMRTKVYALLVEDRGRSDVESLNERVYAELFLTPASDPWLGLFTADTYMALEDGGVVR
ncbi:MAG: hypothetical protein WAL47_18435 [Pyrinomonadaceae bacterium]